MSVVQEFSPTAPSPVPTPRRLGDRSDAGAWVAVVSGPGATGGSHAVGAVERALCGSGEGVGVRWACRDGCGDPSMKFLTPTETQFKMLEADAGPERMRPPSVAVTAQRNPEDELP
jgi:hypothetical protein